ncbi:MAG TPA: TraR/DksA family transcriptional regulator [Pyrinomonadaceae bacterium]|nr:TraR/DksA family transcriptional regulator [Chloracidobacterium sp.]MBP9936649.1 TraR/DksA family transcriptional regulator [Pyrinomonadaceae bacterium]MBK7802331.1 TraR/DksA family transcriptional regulator [Chloracidobacterium sp.]MBK9437200.1 TraR/DksA family transcriptional regulator [Chloracidobacterium sp.]MBK9765931.1 TraR/DksA family transcriptional regulator [Chloracidobacterium sp.]
MSKLSVEEIKEKLLAERELLIAKLKGSDLSIDDSETPDPVDLAVRNYSKNVQLAVSENESKQLALIDEALIRIDNEEYGLCQNCEKEINPKRLAAIPWARYCLECQEMVEKGLLDEE